MEPTRPREIAVSRWWHGADLSAPLPTTDGRAASVVYRGAWSHGIGPDFQGALIDFGDGSLVRGSIEIHLRSSAWRSHGHHLDARYCDVVLHIVLEDDGVETRRADGRLVPLAVIAPDPALLAMLEGAQVDWNLVGGDICAEHIAASDPGAVRGILWRLGDELLGERVARISARLDDQLPADVLFELVMDGLGYSANREPMRLLANRMPASVLDSLLSTCEPGERYELALGLLLGTGGFLPLSPREAEIGRLSPAEVTQAERLWMDRGGAWHHDRLAPTSWERTRVRPANHPLLRLGMAAALLANSLEGLTAAMVECVRRGDDPVTFLVDRSRHGDRPGLGRGRAVAVVASAIMPFLMALADAGSDSELSEMTSRRWEILEAGEANQVTRKAMYQVCGAARVGRVGERGVQGLLRLDRVYCQPRRCMECSIAALVMMRQPEMEAAALE